ncbi:hypothetical protein [Nocardioides pantholopis]|uniref:hypothetical protein n=1 Tax=Nocardioides pantholopis TaxID=2483798 RepID=UPI0019D1BAA3|nr:hypothetical protein [Nocardioides pantholopis]
MSAEEEVGGAVDATAATGPGAERSPGGEHTTFTALTGFFTGLAFVILVPGTYAALLRVFVDNDTAEQLFPLVLVSLAVPLGLTAAPSTRRFGRYMLIGILTTAVVVVGSAALVLWYLYATES